MFESGHPGRAGHGAASRSGFSTKLLRYDPELLEDLRARHERLEHQLAALTEQFRDDAQAAATEAQECAEQLHELRRWEAIRLYPVVSRGLCGDAVAERQWVILRFVVNGLAHRLLRSMEELGAVRDADAASVAVKAVLENLTGYRARNEQDLYPLYASMDPCRARLHA